MHMQALQEPGIGEYSMHTVKDLHPWQRQNNTGGNTG